MAVRAERMRKLAQRRKENVPEHMTRHLRQFSVRFEPYHEVFNKKADGSKGAIKKITSKIIAEAYFAGIDKPAAFEVLVDCDRGYSLADEMEKAMSRALVESCKQIAAKGNQLMKEKQEQLKEDGGPAPEKPVIEDNKGKEPAHVG